MPTAEEWAEITSDVLRLHALFPKEPKKAFFRSDGVTPCGFHPILAGTLFIHEESLPEETRITGAKALFGHDLLEDTTAKLPLWTKNPPKVETYINGMTYEDGQDPFIEMWNRGDEIILLGFFDNIANLFRPNGRTPERVAYRLIKTRVHLRYIESLYPDLLIIKLARGLLA